MGRDLLHRWARNPIMDIDDMPFRCNTVFNGTPGRLGDQTVMVVRIEGQQGYSFFALARSWDGLHFDVDETPCLLPDMGGPWEKWEAHGIEDPRLTVLEGRRLILYTAAGPYGHRIALAETEDFTTYRRIALISEPGNKDGVLFPEKINGLYARLDRPIGNGVGSIWVSYSPDLIHWGDSRRVMSPRPRYWDSTRIGASAPPIKTDRGWLEIYHGLRMTSAGPVYRAGAVMLDLHDPANVVGRCVAPLLSPREPYERTGDVNNVVFPCGAIVEDGGEMKVYYGAADTSICVATGHVDDVIASCFPDDSAAP
jgi:predicted GH43/DUF377 family glycosyl hydrolase